MAEIRIRRRNQFTLPAAVVKSAGLVEGERVQFEVDPAYPDLLTMRLVDRRRGRTRRREDAPRRP